jgi:hypothetical protein
LWPANVFPIVLYITTPETSALPDKPNEHLPSVLGKVDYAEEGHVIRTIRAQVQHL